METAAPARGNLRQSDGLHERRAPREKAVFLACDEGSGDLGKHRPISNARSTFLFTWLEKKPEIKE